MSEVRSAMTGRRRVRSGRRPRLGSWRTKPWANGDHLTAVVYLFVVGLFGGGLVQWGLSYVVVSMATILVAIRGAWGDGFAALGRAPATGRLALVGVAALPLLQLVPLPPVLWRLLPGHAWRDATLSLFGLADTWQPMTLEPASTALCATMAIGFVAFTTLLLRLADADFRRLLRAAFALVVLNILVGLLQVVSDGLPHVQATNMGATLIGFYANKNHMALVLACSILLAGFADVSGKPVSATRRPVVVGYILFALVTLVATNSRAGLGLGILAAAIVLADLFKGVALRWRLAALGAIALLAVAIMSSSAFELVSGRIGDVSDDLRWRFLEWSWPLARTYGGFGSGFGSYTTLFITAEQLAWVKPTIVNAAHNDYLQLVIEGGVPGVLLLVLMVLSLWGCVGAFRSLPRRDAHRREMILGLAVLALFAIHSAVDYPLRRPAAWLFFAIGLAAVYRAQQAALSEPS